VPALSGPAIPSAATWKPSQPIQFSPLSPGVSGEGEGVVPSAEEAHGREKDETLEDDIAEEEPLVNVEHMQLTLQEAWFLLWNLDCLTILHPDTVSNHNCTQPFLLADTQHLNEALTNVIERYMDSFPTRASPYRNAFISSAIPTPRQPFPHQLYRLPPLPLPRLGGERRDQILCGLPSVQARPGFQSRRVSFFAFPGLGR